MVRHTVSSVVSVKMRVRFKIRFQEETFLKWVWFSHNYDFVAAITSDDQVEEQSLNGGVYSLVLEPTTAPSVRGQTTGH